MKEKIAEKFGHRLRVRVSGILIENEEILLVKHRYPGEKKTLWAPPGGGMKFGSSAEENLVREVEEETSLKVEAGRFLFINEFMDLPLHAIELFFEIKRKKGKLRRGSDPEMSKTDQIIESVEFISFKRLSNMDQAQIHNALTGCSSSRDLLNKRGYLKFG